MVQPVLPRNEHFRNPANQALLALAVLSLLPLLITVPVGFNVVVTASVCVFVGCWRSVKAEPPTEAMSHNDALKFPLIGSVVLFSLFLAFKFLPKDLINTVLTGYFVFAGVLALTATVTPFGEQLFSKALVEKRYPVRKFNIPFLQEEPIDLSFTVPELASALASLAFCLWYFFKKHWLANNVLGLAFSIQGIEHLSLGSVMNGVILLSGLFFYDIFWVFCTPVMVSVAKSFDAPIKLLFPRGVKPETGAQPFSMLGLGDIVIPGIFVALVLRYDAINHFRTKYFYSTYVGYSIALVTTIVVMNVFDAAQPALLYIVPAVLGALALHSAVLREFKQVFAWKEETKEKEGGKKDERSEKKGAVKKEPEDSRAEATPPGKQPDTGGRYFTRSAKKQS